MNIISNELEQPFLRLLCPLSAIIVYIKNAFATIPFTLISQSFFFQQNDAVWLKSLASKCLYSVEAPRFP